MPAILSPHAAVPVIDTERLMLRGHRLEDFSACAAMWGDSEVTRYIGGKPFSPEEVWTKVLRYVGHWSLLGFGYWVIQEKLSGRFVGEVGFADFKRDIKPSLEGVPEIGWVLASWASGKGLATEEVRAAVQWSATRFRWARTVCLINPENIKSIRVAEKCGYKRYEHATYKGHAVLMFERLDSSGARLDPTDVPGQLGN